MDTSTDANRGFILKYIYKTTVWHTVKILIRRLITSRLIRTYSVCKGIYFVVGLTEKVNSFSVLVLVCDQSIGSRIVSKLCVFIKQITGTDVTLDIIVRLMTSCLYSCGNLC